jgi:hypothetical protein
MSGRAKSSGIDVTITKDTRKTDRWVVGEATGGYRFCAKMFDEGSIHGINKGRVSKLEIRSDKGIFVNYDRGWDVKPQNPEDKAVYRRVMSTLKAMGKVFEADKPKDLLAKIEENKQKVSHETLDNPKKTRGDDEIC